MNFRRLIYMIMTSAVAILSDSCVKDQIDDYGMQYIEGKETRIALRIAVPEMSVATRADMEEGTDSHINSLWVGIFNANSGNCTYSDFVDIYPNEDHGEFVELQIPTLSGPSYIVAVGNPVDNRGYIYNENGESRSEDLADLLGGVKHWDTYKKIVIRQLSVGDVSTPTDNLIMSGCYYKNLEDPNSAAEWESINYTPVNIPATSNKIVILPGAVHLRRLISQVKFHFEVGDYEEYDPSLGSVDAADGREGGIPRNSSKPGRRIIEVIPQSYQVHNAPYTSWLHERKSGDESGVTNSGDAIKITGNSSITYTDAKLPLKANYRRSSVFNGSQYIEPTTVTRTVNGEEKEDTVYDFDFWMLENKRWAVGEKSLEYTDREKEQKQQVKGDDGEYTDGANTGIYTALCGTGEETMNNSAAFVKVTCRVIYTDDGLDAIQQENDFKEVQYRSAEAVYVIHMGGIHSNWNDFTHRRNHKYTYNVKVVDIDRIIVEAQSESDEVRPDIEGVVTDVVNPPFEVDCHYSLCNIVLTNRERTGGYDADGKPIYNERKFPWRIRVYDGDENVIYIDQDNYEQFDELYWQWIELRPTTDSLTLAAYKPYDYDWDAHPEDKARGRTFRLTDIADITNYPGMNSSGVLDVNPADQKQDDVSTEKRWYTMFINENAYERSLDEGQNNWINYCNKPPRMCWLNTRFYGSSDLDSNYIRSKYVVRQQCIQTFYDATGHAAEDVNAIGMEHINETMGYNLRWDRVTTKYSDYHLTADDRAHDIKNNNGRHNTLLYLAGTPEPSISGTLTFDQGAHGRIAQDAPANSTKRYWADYLDRRNRLQIIEYIDRSSKQYIFTHQLHDPAYLDGSIEDYDRWRAGLPEETRAALTTEPYYVPMAYITTGGTLINDNSDINKIYFLRILDACMNRNRDNNGNGLIDVDEIRWYVPASSEIIDLVIGSKSMDYAPLMDYGLNKKLNSPENFAPVEQPHQANTRFHYATSNQRTLWAEEGTTINPESDGREGTWNLPPQNVRCVRALGTNLATDENTDLTPAFTTNAIFTTNDDGTRTYSKYATEIYPTFFDSKNQRGASPTIGITPHQETHDFNRLGHGGFEFDPLLYEFVKDTVKVEQENKRWVDDYWTESHPAGWYAEDGTYLGPDEYYDINWDLKYPKWREGKTYDSSSGWFKAIPGTGVDWSAPESSRPNPVIKVEQGWTEVVRKGGYYVLDKNKYSKTKVDGYEHFDGFWVGGTTHAEGWFAPDVSSYRAGNKNESPGPGYVWWDAMELLTEYPEGYYWPDPTTGPLDHDPGGYAYFEESIGDVYNPKGQHSLDASSYSPTFIWGHMYAYNVWNVSTGVGWYKIGSDGGAECAGYWSGVEHKPGWYARDFSQGTIDYNPQNVNYSWYTYYLLKLPKFDKVTISSGDSLAAGWYMADESKKGNPDQLGYQYYPEWNVGGEYYEEGWYGIEYSQTQVPGSVYLDPIIVECPAGWYAPDLSQHSDTKQDGYGFFEWEQTVATPEYPRGWYSYDDIYLGEKEHYLDTAESKKEFWDDLNPHYEADEWFGGELIPGHWEKEILIVERVVGEWRDANGNMVNVFVYNENNFVDNHGATLQAANNLCVKKHGGTRGWRLPNMKEAALIKVAMENAGVYKTPIFGGNKMTPQMNGNAYWAKETHAASGYEVGNFLTQTYRVFGTTGEMSTEEKTGYYSGVYYPESTNEVNNTDYYGDNNEWLMGRIACITTNWDRHFYIRCVRDLPDTN